MNFPQVNFPQESQKCVSRRGRTPWLVALGMLALMPTGWLVASVVLRVETPNGTLVVEIDGTETIASIKNGKVILSGADGKGRYTLAPSEGDNKIWLEGPDGSTLHLPAFSMKRGGKDTVRVTVAPRTTDAVKEVYSSIRKGGVFDCPRGALRVARLDQGKLLGISLKCMRDGKVVAIFNAKEGEVRSGDGKSLFVHLRYGTGHDMTDDSKIIAYFDNKSIDLSLPHPLVRQK